jgi:hypothetical protein
MIRLSSTVVGGFLWRGCGTTVLAKRSEPERMLAITAFVVVRPLRLREQFNLCHNAPRSVELTATSSAANKDGLEDLRAIFRHAFTQSKLLRYNTNSCECCLAGFVNTAVVSATLSAARAQTWRTFVIPTR